VWGLGLRRATAALAVCGSLLTEFRIVLLKLNWSALGSATR